MPSCQTITDFFVRLGELLCTVLLLCVIWLTGPQRYDILFLRLKCLQVYWHFIKYIKNYKNLLNQGTIMVKLHPSDQHLEHPASGAFSENLWRWLSEDARYETFPGKSGLFPSHMIRDYAKYGFFFQNDPCPLMRQGWLHCAFCPWSTTKWERNDLAAIDHFKESPLCPLLRGFETPNVQSWGIG